MADAADVSRFSAALYFDATGAIRFLGCHDFSMP